MLYILLSIVDEVKRVNVKNDRAMPVSGLMSGIAIADRVMDVFRYLRLFPRLKELVQGWIH